MTEPGMYCDECGELLVGDEASYDEYDGLCAECEEREA